MTPFKSLLLRLAIAGFALNARAQNLVVNGGFEDGFTGWLGSYGFRESPNTIDGTHVGMLTDIGHSSVGMTLSQIIPTEPGVAYDISFALRLADLFEAGPGIWIPVSGGSGTTTITLRWDGRPLLSVMPISRDNWSFHTYRVIADDDSAMLNFFNPSPNADPFIDGISVTKVPEPNIAHLTWIGVAALFAMRGKLAKNR